ncbi:putative ribonuclease P protein subunit 3 [Cladobotryum mycophilum]|uniref:Ribonuclease P protein subunit 3 n=1 Tax=Cladobotryum mycophilum TaxID=491253 RepID=A0ABR0SMD3_9HYPO
MLYDLNIAWSPATSQDRLLQILSVASSLGYATVALNHTLELPLPGNPTSPFPQLPPPSPSSRLPSVLRRATFALADPAASNYRLQTLVNVYDLLAIRPLTEKAFQNACITLDIPLISLDMTQHFPFHFRPKPCMAAVSRGVRFEVCYSQALAADQRGRANFIANTASLIRATRGRGIILSSEAKSALGLRAPADVVNLLNMWGLPSEKAMEGLRSIPRSVVMNEGLKRNGFRGVVDIVQVAKKDVTKGDQDDDQSSAQEQTSKKEKNQKRKNGEDAQPVSKRQAKKMKLAARSAAPGKGGT